MINQEGLAVVSSLVGYFEEAEHLQCYSDRAIRKGCFYFGGEKQRGVINP